ncbi:MAG: HD domain-containing protein [bacterium]|nr:HD domain-containing protein [bacterium]
MTNLSGEQLVERAKEIAIQAHLGAFYDDRPYIEHPLEVASIAREHGYGSLVVATCLLHDVVEDTDISHQDLMDRGIPYIVADAVELVTFKPGESGNKISKARMDPIGHATKFCDSTGNLRNAYKMVDCELKSKRIVKYHGYLSQLIPGLPIQSDIERFAIWCDK